VETLLQAQKFSGSLVARETYVTAAVFASQKQQSV